MKTKCYIFYDGMCPICKNYVAYRDLSHKYNLFLVDVRKKSNLLSSFKKNNPNINFNNTMAVKIGSKVYVGSEATDFIEKAAYKKSILSHLISLMLSNKYSVKVYPILVFLRKLLLFLLNRPQI